MKRTVQITLAVVMGFALLVSAGYGAEPKYSGFLGDDYKYLQPGPEGGAKMRWLKPGVDFSKYKKLMIDSVVFYFADDSDYKGIDPQFMKEMADKFNQVFVDTMKDAYPIVAEPGPDVARLRFAITRIKQSRPVLSGVTSVVPVGLAVSLVKRGTVGSWTGSGATSAEVMVLDSMTNDVIALAADDRSAGFTERFSKWGSTEEAFKFWAERVKVFMDETRTIK
ncbi:MAG TPA: DUF3313 domain-containing protein [Syntrophorhabdaceae bacterium]